MNRQYFLIGLLALMLVLVLGCNLPLKPTPTPVPTPTVLPPTPTLPPTKPPALVLGSTGNPVILALPPNSKADQIEAGDAVAQYLLEATGYAVVTIAPDSYTDLLDDLANGNAHIAFLSPYAYDLAYQQGHAFAGLISRRDDHSLYGAQFIANAEAGYISYYNEITGQNTADAAQALAQFQDQRPCWTDPSFPSGNLIPAGVLAQNRVETEPAAVLQSHYDVVRALYFTGFCDFGATYVDARTFPALKEEFPDIKDKVIVIWRIPDVIPYDVLVISDALSDAARREMSEALLQLMASEGGPQLVKTAFGIDGLELADDNLLAEFRSYLEHSGAELNELVQ